MAPREAIHYRLLPAGRIFAATGLFLIGAMMLEPALTAPVLATWLTVAGVQLWWPRIALQRIEVRFLSSPRSVRAGQAITLALELRNTSAWLRLGPLHLQPALSGRVTALPSQEVAAVPLPRETRMVRIGFGLASRGRHHASCAAIATLHPFALTMASRQTPELVIPLTVWCARLPGCSLRLSGDKKPPPWMSPVFERQRISRGNEDRAQLRAYRPGDPARAIHWRLSARARELIVLERQHQRSPRFWLCLDTVAGGWSHPAQFERMLQLATTLAEDYFRHGSLRGIVLNQHARSIPDRHALGIALDSFASLRRYGEADLRTQRRRTRTAQTRSHEILDIVPGNGRKVRLVDAHGRAVLEV
jgi:uncharacterized protein (DUF58 family)